MVVVLGYGFIGHALVEALQRENIPCKVISIEPNPNEPGLNYVSGNLNDTALLDKELEGATMAIYLAHGSVPFTSMQDLSADCTKNIFPALKVLDALTSKKIRLLYFSTGGAVYGNHPLAFREDLVEAPISSYGLTKLMIEKYIGLYHHNYGLQFDILRPSNIYGCNFRTDVPQGIIGNLINAFKQKKEFTIWGDGSAQKDYLYMDDLMSGILKMVRANMASNEVFNISFGNSYTVHDIYEIVKADFGFDIPLTYLKPYSFDVQHVVIDSSKFSKHFDWKSTVGIKEGVHRIIAYMNK